MTTREPSRRTPAPGRARVSPWPFVGMIGLACVLFLDLASVMLVDGWLVVVMSVAWVVGLVLAVAWWGVHPEWLPWIPVVLFVVWLLVVLLHSGGTATSGPT
jgi:hypothetical protein